VAAQQRPTPRVLSLDEAIALAVKNSPQIKEEQFGVLKRQSQRAQADAARFAQLEITVVGGPSPRARGDQISSPDSKTDPAITGMFGLATVSLVQRCNLWQNRQPARGGSARDCREPGAGERAGHQGRYAGL
jgi:hypothetical protein